MEEIKLNMKEVAMAVLEKNPHRLLLNDSKSISDGANYGKPATELAFSTDVLTFSVNPVGKNFENIPYTIDQKNSGTYYKTVDLIGIDGCVVESIPSSKYNRFKEDELFQKERYEFKFKSDPEVIVVAMVLRKTGPTASETVLMMLSKPHTIAMMQEKRDSVVLENRKANIISDMKKIEMLWA